MTAHPTCSWCGSDAGEDYWSARSDTDEHQAILCRLEHVVPWAMKGPGWGAVVLVHHRAAHEITETFESVEAMRAWAAAGGRWQ
jgi:hypothetical protein